MKRALLVIDAQIGFQSGHFGPRNNPDMETNCRKILKAFRDAGEIILHIKHLSKEKDSPLRSDLPGVAFIEGLEPGESEKVFHKHVHSAFIGTDLEVHVRKQLITSMVAIGFTSDHCVSTTVRMGCDLGLEMTMVSDATATFDRGEIPAEIIHRSSLASLSGEFAQILTSSELISTL